MIAKLHDKRAGIKKLAESKKRWRKKIEGDDYVSSEEEEEEPKMYVRSNHQEMTKEHLR